MKRIYLVVIGVALVALLLVTALSVTWARSQDGGVIGPGMTYDGGTYGSEGDSISIDEAAAAVEHYLDSYGKNLVLVEVMEFSRNLYAEVEEKDTGIHAMELLVDKSTAQVHPEIGPNMMWNTKYSHTRGTMGMMGNYYRSGSLTAAMPVTPEQARRLAQQYLDTGSPGVTVGDADTFYGYYTLHTLRSGQVEGMLSINGYSGAAWYHGWHGAFIGMKEYE